MGHSAGLRAGTRYAFSRSFRKKGLIHLSTYLRQYKVGDIVDIVVNGAVQKGMPYKSYNGKTGTIAGISKNAVAIIVRKRVGGRIFNKLVHLRVEHIRPSRSREGAKLKGEKRQPALPREARYASITNEHAPETLLPTPYDIKI